MRNSTQLAVVISTLLIASSAYAQVSPVQVVEWNYNGSAAAAGSGCDSSDTFFIEAGNQISVIFSNLGVDLSGTIDDSRVGRGSCNIVIPARVRRGWYLARLEQTLIYGYNRTEGTEGTVSATSRFFGQPAGRIQVAVPTPGYDSWDEPFIEKTFTSRWRVTDFSWCRGADFEGTFWANLTVQSFRESARKDIVVQIEGEDIRFDAIGHGLVCP